jgi:ferrochelatase
MAQASNYERQLAEAAHLVASGVGIERYRLVYQSRSGPPHIPWLGPDIGEALRALNSEGVSSVVVVPIGFISDHMEVLYDLDTEAREIAEEIGLRLVRAQTAGTHPAFVGMIRELFVERMSAQPARRALGEDGPSHDICPHDCCLKEIVQS